MLSNYAIFLGFDPEPLLLRFAEGLQANLAARQALAASLLPAKPASQLAALADCAVFSQSICWREFF
jgi:hypothetical protein